MVGLNVLNISNIYKNSKIIDAFGIFEEKSPAIFFLPFG